MNKEGNSMEATGSYSNVSTEPCDLYNDDCISVDPCGLHRGDCVSAGPCELYNADCISVMKKLPDLSIDLLLTDIPYDEVNREDSGLRNLNKGKADIATFDLDEFLFHCRRLTKGTIYIFCGTEQVSRVRGYFSKDKKWSTRCSSQESSPNAKPRRSPRDEWSTRHCVWEKTNPSPMNGQYMWLSSIENCIFLKRRGKTVKGGGVFNAHCKSAVWRFPTTRSKIHPTEKPLKLLSYLVETSSNVGDIVFDPCFGSGSTLVSAKMLGRRFGGCELDEEYFNKGKERINETRQACGESAT